VILSFGCGSINFQRMIDDPIAWQAWLLDPSMHSADTICCQS
jgi:hypothetical protein